MTFIECVPAAVTTLDPLVIFRGQTTQQQWFPDNELHRFKHWLFTTSKNGWTSNSHALKWPNKLFIPHTKPLNPDQYRLLILDGHGSHATDDFIWDCFQNQIYIIYLPAHTSHVLQPLDLSVFSPLKTAYRKWAGHLYS